MISKMFRIASIFILAALALSSTVGAAPCSIASLSGNYGLLTSGTSIAGTPVTSLIHFTFDPTTATFTSLETSSHDGVLIITPHKGTYEVAPDCTARTTIKAAGETLHVAFVVTSTGFFNLNESTGATIEGFGVKQGDRACSNDSVKGNFGFEATGSFAPGAPFTGPAAFVGELKLGVDDSGDGVLSGHVTASEDGTIFTFADEPVTGAYSVNSDCTGTATITPKGQPTLNFDFVVVDCGKQILALETDANTVVSGTLIKDTDDRHDEDAANANDTPVILRTAAVAQAILPVRFDVVLASNVRARLQPPSPLVAPTHPTRHPEAATAAEGSLFAFFNPTAAPAANIPNVAVA
jgi:hypothetical protein